MHKIGKISFLFAFTLMIMGGSVMGQTNPSPFDMSTGSSYSFSSWNSNSTAGTYPSNMYIWQHATTDPTLSTVFTGNYTISYGLTSKSRCSGQGSNGISFVNTSSTNTGGGNVGALVIALITTNRTSINVNWVGRTIGILTYAAGTQDRATSIRLQYKVGSSGSWTDVSSLEYSSLASSNTYNTANSYLNLSQSLPAACEGQALIYLRWVYYTAGGTNGSRPELAVDDISINSSASSPAINVTSNVNTFTTSYGTASAAQSFAISGSNLTASILATAPSGFEVSRDNATFKDTVWFNQSSGTATGNLYIRLKATASVGVSYNNQAIALTSSGATTVNITSSASGNIVSPKALTISGLSAANKTYDGTTTATLSGTAAYSGLVNGESFPVTGTPLANFSDALVGNGKTVTVTGYAAPSSNYTVTQPSLTANITAIQLTAPTITGITGGNTSLSVSFTAPSNANSTGAAISNYKYSIDGGSTFTAFSPAQTTSPISITSGLTNGTTYNVKILAVNSYGDGVPSSTMQGTPIANSTVNASASLTAFTTTYGTASSSQSFAVSGSYLSADIVATAPSGYEVSSDGITYGATATFTQSSGNVSGTLYVRLKATAIVGTYNSLNIAFTSTGASTVNVSTTASGNAVSAKGLTITGLTAGNKTYDGTTSVSVSGTPTYSGLVNGESFAIGGSSNWAFATKTVGTSKSITQTGSYTAPSSNYTVTQPTLTADITAATLTISNPSVTSKTYDGSTTATITGTLSGIISPDVVTLVASGSFASANAASGISVTAACTLSGTDAGNYVLTQPTGLTGDITKANQTITFGSLVNKFTTDAPFSLTATSSSSLTVSYVSSNTAVATVAGNTVTIVGAGTTTITASQTGDANYNAATSVNQSFTVTSIPTMTELVVPQYIGSKTASSINNARTPIAICLQFDNLTASTTYDIGLQLEINGTVATSFGAGNIWNGTTFSGTTLSSAFTTNSSGSSGPVWFYFQPTGNPTRFDAAQIHNVRIKYVANGGSLPTNPNFIGTKSITALDIATTARTTATSDDGAFITGTLPSATGGKYVLLYDNETGTGDPIYSYQVVTSTATNATQSDLPTAINDIYLQSGTSAVGKFAGVVPIGANNINGIRRIEVRNSDNTVLVAYTSSNGKWGSLGDFTTLTKRNIGTIDYSNVNNLTLNGNVTLSAATSVYGTVTVGSGATLTTGGLLTMKSNASGTARIANSAGTISGDVTVERYIPQNSNRAWRTLSVPTYGSQTIANAWQLGTMITGPASCTGMDATTNGYSMYTYNASTDNLVGVSSTLTAINNNSANPAAYFLYVRGDRTAAIANSNANPGATTLSSTGAIYQGAVISTDISANNGSSATTYHLIGNPYVSPININSFLTNANNANNIENYIYVWDPKMTNTANGVGGILTLTYNGTGYDPTTTGLSYSNGTTELPSGMAFFVQKKSSNCNNCTVNFTESMKSTGAISSNGFKTASQLDGKMQINLGVKINDSTEGVADGLLAFYDAAADAQVVASEDAAKMSNFGESMSIRNGSSLLAVEKRPLNNIDTLFINTEGLTNRNYRLVFNPSQFDPSVKAQLIDHYQNLTYPVALSQKTVYDFTIDTNPASKAKDRFELRYNSSTLGIGNTSNIETVSVYPNPTRDAQVFIAMHNQAAGIYQVQLVNAMGITVQHYDLHYEKGMRPTVDLSNVAKGIYYLKLSNDQKEQVVVKIINL